MPAPRSSAVSIGNPMMERLKAQQVDSFTPGAPPGARDEYGRLIEFTGNGFKEAGDIITCAGDGERGSGSARVLTLNY